MHEPLPHTTQHETCKQFFVRVLVLLSWLFVWQLASVLVNNTILLAGPLDTALRLVEFAGDASFWASIVCSACRIVAGFVLASALALACALLSWRFSVVRAWVTPAVSFVKSVPVVCIIVLLLVWAGSSWVPLIAAAMMVFPSLYFNCLEGLQQSEPHMIELMRVFHVGHHTRVRVYYWSHLQPFITSAAKVAIGVSWKAGIAAEVIGIPTGSVGAGIYLAKLGLDTAGLFAWTLTIVALSVACEKVFLAALRFVGEHSAALPKNYRASCAGHTFTPNTQTKDRRLAIALENVQFAYDNKPVLNHVNAQFEEGSRTCIMAPSGTGKTTLLLALAGLLRPSCGQVSAPAHVAIMFQENRLFENLSAWDNVLLVSVLPEAERLQLKYQLDAALGGDACTIYPRECSGGMLRKIALSRALSAGGQCLLLDEPFTGLDSESRASMARLILQFQHGRTLLVATHNTSDANLLHATVYTL